MPTFIDHIYQYKHNQACARHLLEHTPFLDWAVIAAFYSALHIVDAGLSNLNITFNQGSGNQTSWHAWRVNTAQRTFGNACYRAYRELKIASERARYLSDQPKGCNSIPAIDRFNSTDFNDYVKINLQTVLDEVHKKCGNIK